MTTYVTRQEGVLILKHGRTWGIEYEDGHSTAYGWVSPEMATIYDPKYLHKPTDATYKDSPYVSKLIDATLVRVVRTTTTEYEEDGV